MKYLAVIRGANEPDNNTPSNEVFVKVVECFNDREVMATRAKIYKDFEGDFIEGADVSMYKIDDLSDYYKRVMEVW